MNHFLSLIITLIAFLPIDFFKKLYKTQEKTIVFICTLPFVTKISTMNLNDTITYDGTKVLLKNHIKNNDLRVIKLFYVFLFLFIIQKLH